MKNRKIIFDISFILVAGLVSLVLNQYDLIEEYHGFVLVQLLIAYYFGQFVGKRTKGKQKLFKESSN